MIENLAHLVKHTSPTRYDTAPYATLWVLHGDKHANHDRIWLQTSDDMDRMDWQEMPEVLGSVFEQFYSNPRFIDECLMVLREKKEKQRSSVKEIKFVR